MTEDLHRLSMKASYQRNMLRANVSVILLVVLAVLLLDTLNTLPGLQGSAVQTLPQNVVVQEVGSVSREMRPAHTALPGFNPYARRHEGFIGFTRLRPTAAVSAPIVVPQPVYDDVSEDLSLDDVQVSFSMSPGPDTGVFVSSEVINASAVFGSLDSRKLVNRDVDVAYRVDPEYPFVARDEDKEGEIVVLVYVDSTGSLGAFPDWLEGGSVKTLTFTVQGKAREINYALKEEPSGWYFAESFLKVLPEWRFIPRVIEGRPVNALLKIKYRFCLGVNCGGYEFIPMQS